MDKDIFSVSNSILLGSIIIAGSIALSGNFGSSNTTPKAVMGNTNPQGQAQDTGTPVSVKIRRDAPSLGAGKVTIIEFSDFQCPFCQSFYNGAYKQIKAKYIDTGKVKLVFMHFPLAFHANAQKSGEASECANRQGKFWEYHDLLFKYSKSDGAGLDIASLKKYATDLGLDTTKFNICLDKGETADMVKADMAEGQRVGVSGTPTFVINGKKVVGALPYDQFEKTIEEAIK
jgi:protein-disulfide isomerase